MPGRRGTLTVRVVSDTKAAEQGLDRFTTKVAATGDRMVDAGKKMTLFATVPVAAAMGAAVNAASDLNETLSKSNTVFGESAKEVEDWADGAAESFGQSKREALGAASSFGNMFTQLGIGSDRAANMSRKMTELASDFASFHNADISDVIDAQSAAFRGEYDALQRYVPTINAATVEQKAFAMTGKGGTAELTAQEKALAVHALMLEGAGRAMGDFDRTAGSAANQLRTAKAAMEDASAEIGEDLLPIVADLAGGVAEAAEKFSQLPEPVQTSVLALAGLLAVAGPLTAGIGGVINMVGKMRSGVDTASDALDTMRLKSMYLGESLGPAGLVASLGAVGAVVGVGTVLYRDYAKTKAEAKRITDLYVEALRSENDELDTSIDKIGASELATKEYATAIRESGVGFDVLLRGVRESGEGLELLDDRIGMIATGAGGGLRQALEDAGLSGTRLGDALTRLQGAMSAGDFADLLNDLDGLSDRYDDASSKAKNLDAAEKDVAGSTDAAGDAAKGAAPKVDELSDAQAEAEEKSKKLEDAIKAVSNALRSQFDPYFAVTDAILSQEEAQRKVEEAHWAVTAAADAMREAIAREGEGSWAAKDAAYEHEEALRNLDGAEREAARSVLDVAEATRELKTRLEEGNIPLSEAYAELDHLTALMPTTKGEVEKLKEEMFYAALQAQELGKQRPMPVVDLDASQYWAKAAEFKAQWEQFWGSFTTALGVPLPSAAPLSGPWSDFIAAAVGKPPERHTGGPVQARRPYLVKRDEMFVPNQNGRILSPARTERAMAGAGNGGGVTVMPGASLVTLNGGDHDAESVAHHIARYLARR